MNMTEIIKEKLREIELQENVKVLLAVESGSRAWGFESPDSDYDVRFIYVRPAKDYLRLDPQKDIIEWQLDEILDINGWDLNKALIQFRKGNATLFEWSNSPICYLRTPEWDTIYHVAKNYFSAKSSIYHYYGTAKSTFSNYLQGDQVKYKKYFYALRPLLACKYVEEYQCPPPVLFSELLKINLPDLLRDGIEELLEIKKITDEKTLSPQIPVIYDFISNELKLQANLSDSIPDDHNKNWELLNSVFYEIVSKTKIEEKK